MTTPPLLPSAGNTHQKTAVAEAGDNSGVQVLCLCGEPQPFLEAGNRLAVQVLAVAGVRQLLDALMATPCNGIILEMRQLMRASQHEKAIVQEFVDSFPVLYVNVVQEGGVSKLKVMGCLETFLAEVCTEFTARTVRRSIRHNLNLPLFLAREADPDFKNPEKSYTLDISESGVFVYTPEDWSPESWVRMRFVDLEDGTPVVGHIRWQRPWGVGLAMSGLGVKFGRISAGQHATLCQRFLLRDSFHAPNVDDIQEAMEDVLREIGG